MINISKLNPRHEEKVRYHGEVLERTAQRVIVQAYWSHPALDLGYTQFVPGDHFLEYYYTDRWFNIFDIRGKTGQRKGWYCNIAEPAIIAQSHIEQVDLYLDVWVNPEGQTRVLDEDEFHAATILNAEQRSGAQHGLQMLLSTVAARQEAFTDLVACSVQNGDIPNS
ncbi:MAG TPA: DUF402 domain-containing protein [Ktedonobacteraceae bacterium]|jgi:hypothetical protein|nr:DUF402 domain-containing protein [Ktedonobacteraceae bacterium]